MGDLPIIDDNNYREFIGGSGNPKLYGRGYRGMWKNEGLKSQCGRFSDIGVPLIPEDEWKDRIRQKQKDKSTIPNLCDDFGLHVKNQRRTNYCWIFAPARCCEIRRLQEIGEKVWYSPASVGSIIKNFRNVGGWGSQGLNYMREKGINLSDDWPDTAISRPYYTDENQELKLRHIALEYYYLENWAERVSCILADIPTADGYPWWGHEVTGVELTIDLDLVIDNSWSTSWGDNGRGILSGRRKYAGDSIAITSMTPM